MIFIKKIDIYKNMTEHQMYIMYTNNLEALRFAIWKQIFQISQFLTCCAVTSVLLIYY